MLTPTVENDGESIDLEGPPEEPIPTGIDCLRVGGRAGARTLGDSFPAVEPA